MAFYPHPIVFISHIPMNLIYVHAYKQNNKGPFTLQGQNLVNEDKFSFCAPRPGFVLLLVETEFELERKIQSRAAITEIRFVDCACPMPIRCLSDAYPMPIRSKKISCFISDSFGYLACAQLQKKLQKIGYLCIIVFKGDCVV